MECDKQQSEIYVIIDRFQDRLANIRNNIKNTEDALGRFGTLDGYCSKDEEANRPAPNNALTKLNDILEDLDSINERILGISNMANRFF